MKLLRLSFLNLTTPTATTAIVSDSQSLPNYQPIAFFQHNYFLNKFKHQNNLLLSIPPSTKIIPSILGRSAAPLVNSTTTLLVLYLYLFEIAINSLKNITHSNKLILYIGWSHPSIRIQYIHHVHRLTLGHS